MTSPVCHLHRCHPHDCFALHHQQDIGATSADALAIAVQAVCYWFGPGAAEEVNKVTIAYKIGAKQ